MLVYNPETSAIGGNTYSSGCFARLRGVRFRSADTLLGSSSSSASLLGGRLRLLGLLGLLSLLSSGGSSLLRLSGGGALLGSRFRSSFLLGELHGSRRTLGLGEFTLLNTCLNSLVELAIESIGRCRCNLVVCQNIFLDGLATVMGRSS